MLRSPAGRSSDTTTVSPVRRSMNDSRASAKKTPELSFAHAPTPGAARTLVIVPSTSSRTCSTLGVSDADGFGRPISTASPDGERLSPTAGFTLSGRSMLQAVRTRRNRARSAHRFGRAQLAEQAYGCGRQRSRRPLSGALCRPRSCGRCRPCRRASSEPSGSINGGRSDAAGTGIGWSAPRSPSASTHRRPGWSEPLQCRCSARHRTDRDQASRGRTRTGRC